MTARRSQALAAALDSDRGWMAARRAYCALCVAMTGYFAFVAAWVALNPAL